MSRLLIPHRRKRWKPPLGARVDWSHPLSRGLVGCWDFGQTGREALNLLSGEPIASRVPSAWSVVPDEHGLALAHNSWNSTSDFLIPEAYTAFNDASITFDVHGNDDAFSPHWLACYGTGGEYAYRVYKGGTNIYFYRYDGATYANAINDSAATGCHRLIGWHRNGSVPQLIDNGVLVTGIGASPLDFSGKTFNYCAVIRPSAAPLGKISWLRVWNRAIDEGEAWQLYVDPFCFLDWPTSRLYLIVPGTGGVGTPFEGVVAAGSVTPSGTTPSEAAGFESSASAGSVTPAGTTPSPAYGFEDLVSAGNVTPSGATPSLASGFEDIVTVGYVTPSGTQPSISAGFEGVIVVGSVTPSGAQPNEAFGAELVVVVGNVTPAGCQPEGYWGGAFEGIVTAGSVSPSGASPSVVHGFEAIVSAGSVTPSGVTAVIAAGQELVVLVGSVTPSGGTPMISAGFEDSVQSPLILSEGFEGVGYENQSIVTEIETGSGTSFIDPDATPPAEWGVPGTHAFRCKFTSGEDIHQYARWDLPSSHPVVYARFRFQRTAGTPGSIFYLYSGPQTAFFMGMGTAFYLNSSFGYTPLATDLTSIGENGWFEIILDTIAGYVAILKLVDGEWSVLGEVSGQTHLISYPTDRFVLGLRYCSSNCEAYYDSVRLRRVREPQACGPPGTISAGAGLVATAGVVAPSGSQPVDTRGQALTIIAGGVTPSGARPYGTFGESETNHWLLLLGVD